MRGNKRTEGEDSVLLRMRGVFKMIDNDDMFKKEYQIMKGKKTKRQSLFSTVFFFSFYQRGPLHDILRVTSQIVLATSTRLTHNNKHTVMGLLFCSQPGDLPS